MLILLVIFITILSLFFYYSFFIKPKRQIQNYKKQFEALGFKPYLIPFKPFQILTMVLFNEGKKSKDIFHFYKKDLQGYDLIIGNSFNRISLQFMSPDLIKEFCDHERDWHYEKDKKINELEQMIIGKGLVLSEGEVWKKKRKTLNQVFNFKFLSSQPATIVSCCQEAFGQVLRDQTKGSTQRFSIKNFAVEFTSNFIFRGFLGGNLKKEKINDKSPAKVMKEVIDNLLPLYEDLVAVVLGPKFLKFGLREKDRKFITKLNSFNDWAASYVKSRVEEEENIIKDRGDSYEALDIISSLAFLNYKSQPNKPYSNDDLVSELKTFLLAAVETTSSLFMSMIFNVYKNPEVLEKLKKQIDSKIKEQINFEDLKQMAYLEAIQNQTLRMMGPASGIIPRRAVCDHVLAGVNIKKDIYVDYYSIANHYSQKYFPEPTKFIPERWLANEQSHKLHPFAFVAFHGGPRACIGKHVALLESKIAMILFIQKFKEVKVLLEEWQGQIQLVFWPKDYEVEVKL